MHFYALGCISDSVLVLRPASDSSLCVARHRASLSLSSLLSSRVYRPGYLQSGSSLYFNILSLLLTNSKRKTLSLQRHEISLLVVVVVKSRPLRERFELDSLDLQSLYPRESQTSAAVCTSLFHREIYYYILFWCVL